MSDETTFSFTKLKEYQSVFRINKGVSRDGVLYNGVSVKRITKDKEDDIFKVNTSSESSTGAFGLIYKLEDDDAIRFIEITRIHAGDLATLPPPRMGTLSLVTNYDVIKNNIIQKMIEGGIIIYTNKDSFGNIVTECDKAIEILSDMINTEGFKLSDHLSFYYKNGETTTLTPGIKDTKSEESHDTDIDVIDTVEPTISKFEEDVTKLVNTAIQTANDAMNDSTKADITLAEKIAELQQKNSQTILTNLNKDTIKEIASIDTVPLDQESQKKLEAYQSVIDTIKKHASDAYQKAEALREYSKEVIHAHNTYSNQLNTKSAIHEHVKDDDIKTLPISNHITLNKSDLDRLNKLNDELISKDKCPNTFLENFINKFGDSTIILDLNGDYNGALFTHDDTMPRIIIPNEKHTLTSNSKDYKTKEASRDDNKLPTFEDLSSQVKQLQSIAKEALDAAKMAKEVANRVLSEKQ